MMLKHKYMKLTIIKKLHFSSSSLQLRLWWWRRWRSCSLWSQFTPIQWFWRYSWNHTNTRQYCSGSWIFHYQCWWFISWRSPSWPYGTGFWTFYPQPGCCLHEKIWKGTNIWHAATKALYSMSCVFYTWLLKPTALHGVFIVHSDLLPCLLLW